MMGFKEITADDLLPLLPVERGHEIFAHKGAVMLAMEIGIQRLGMHRFLAGTTPKKARSQLAGLADALDALEAALGDMSLTANMHLEDVRDRLGYSWTVSFPAAVRAWLHENYPGLAETARAAAAEPATAERGKRSDERINRLADSLAMTFFLATGRFPTRSVENETDDRRGSRETGEFHDFVKRVIDLAQLELSPATITRRAIDRRNSEKLPAARSAAAMD